MTASAISTTPSPLFAFLTRKNTADLAQVLKILSLRGHLQGWTFVPIEGLDEAGVAQVLGESRLLLSFGHKEVLCLSNLEALACGCRLIGYDGLAGREYFPATDSVVISVGDIVAFCEAVESFVGNAAVLSDEHAVMAKKVSDFVRSTYSERCERASVELCINRLLSF